MSKEDLLKDLYNDTKLAINSVQKLYKYAKEKDNSITLSYVNGWYKKQAVNQRKETRKYNSFVADLPRQQFQIDFAYMTFLDEDNIGKYKYAFICIDVFSKYVHVVPCSKISSKDAADSFKKCMDIMGTPIYIVSDKGNEFSGKEMKELLFTNFIEHMITLKHAYFVERFILTLKSYFLKKLFNKDIKWYTILDDFLKSYNNEERTTTGVSPNDGTKDINALKIRVRLLENSKRNRKNKIINVGDEVRTYNKGRGIAAKSFAHNKWSDDIYKITDVVYEAGIKKYKLEGKQNTYFHSDLLKI